MRKFPGSNKEKKTGRFRERPEPIELPYPKFMELADGYSGGSISSSGKVRSVVKIGKKNFVCTGKRGMGNSCKTCDAYEVVPLEAYEGDLEPLEYPDHWIAVNNDERERCYRGMKVTYRNEEMVFIGDEHVFKPTEVGKQKILDI